MTAADAITVEHAEASRDSGRRDDPVPANRPINMNDAGISSVYDSGVLRQDSGLGRVDHVCVDAEGNSRVGVPQAGSDDMNRDAGEQQRCRVQVSQVMEPGVG